LVPGDPAIAQQEQEDGEFVPTVEENDGEGEQQEGESEEHDISMQQ
jgi:hypothetical protein